MRDAGMWGLAVVTALCGAAKMQGYSNALIITVAAVVAVGLVALYVRQLAIAEAEVALSALQVKLKDTQSEAARLSQSLSTLQQELSSVKKKLSAYEGEKSILSTWNYGELSQAEDILHRTLEQIRQLKEKEMRRRFENADASLCAICNSGKLEVLFRPCRHLCCCAVCANKLRECPICRGTIANKEKIFLQT